MKPDNYHIQYVKSRRNQLYISGGPRRTSQTHTLPTTGPYTTTMRYHKNCVGLFRQENIYILIFFILRR